MDVVSAFSNGVVEKDIFMEVIEGLQRIEINEITCDPSKAL